MEPALRVSAILRAPSPVTSTPASMQFVKSLPASSEFGAK
jgi:hypothetical protein